MYNDNFQRILNLAAQDQIRHKFGEQIRPSDSEVLAAYPDMPRLDRSLYQDEYSASSRNKRML